MVKGIDRKRPRGTGGAAGCENGRDVFSPIRFIQSANQEISGDACGCGGRARVVAPAFHGQEPGNTGAMNTAESICRASAHRVPDEKDRSGRELGVLTLARELGKCTKQRFIARGAVDQRGGANQRHVSPREFECATPYFCALGRKTPDAAASARGAPYQITRIKILTCRRISEARQEHDRDFVRGDSIGQKRNSILVREELASIDRRRRRHYGRRGRSGRRSRRARNDARSARASAAGHRDQREQCDRRLHRLRTCSGRRSEERCR